MVLQLQEFQAHVLESYGAEETEIKELSVYNQNIFDHSNLRSPGQFPLDSEAHVAIWSEYPPTDQQSSEFGIRNSELGHKPLPSGVLPNNFNSELERSDVDTEIDIFAWLKNMLVQLHFPIQEGISQTEAYRAATLKGINPSNLEEATGLILQQPEKLKLNIYASLAGEIPVLRPGNREDFVTLVQALTKRNEPKEIPPSMGACMIAGYNNWLRIHRHLEGLSPEFNSVAWQEEFKRLIPQKHLYQDRFIILSDGFYSNVSPEDMGLTESEWRDLSVTIRLEHECTHYFTRRLFNSMQNNILDELIADYRGIVAALGYYRADWFLRFMGLESFPDYRESGRLQNYRGHPTLSDPAFKVLQALVVAAAQNLEHFDRKYAEELKLKQNQPLMLIALTYLTLEELASDQAFDRLQSIFQQLQDK